MSVPTLAVGGNYAAAPSAWDKLKWKSQNAAYFIERWVRFGVTVWAVYLFYRFVVAVENSHLLIGLVD